MIAIYKQKHYLCTVKNRAAASVICCTHIIAELAQLVEQFIRNE